MNTYKVKGDYLRNLKESSELFFNYFMGYVKSLNSLKTDGHTNTFRCIIQFSILDSLSKCAFPEKDGDFGWNKRRFLKFLTEYCCWHEVNRVSFPHLERLLLSQEFPTDHSSKLRAYVEAVKLEWEKINRPSILDDCPFDEVASVWPFAKEQLEKITHGSLLWEMRNSLIHETRMKGQSMNSLVSGEIPGYHGSIDKNNKLELWHLVYPVEFLLKLILLGIQNLKEKCLKDGIDPYDSYDFGPYFINKLNK